MLENVVAWVLNNYVGEYLENLNTDQLSFALLSGQLELENVPLKKSALQKFDVPLEVKSGVLGKLTLSIPLTRIRSEPWVLKLSDVLIIVGPRSQKRYDVETTEQTEQTKKEIMLNELEKKHCKQLFETMAITSTITDEQESWWGASIIATVVNNIQLILTNVHVRYEDDQTLPNGLSFICGIRIQKMTVQTTNHHWKPGFVEPQEGVNVFKKLELQGFSLYWNSNQTPAKNISTIKDLQNLLSPEDVETNTYIIEPCSIELRMEKNTSKLPLKGNPPIPRFKFWVKQERIIVELSRRQMSELRALNREWSRYERGRLHRKWRPVAGVAENAKEWWKFAYSRIIDETRRSNSRRTWSFALTRAHHLNAYARAYRRRLLVLISNESARKIQDAPLQNDPTRPTLGTEERTIMKQIERDDQYTFNELHVFREIVFRKLLREKEIELGLTPDEERTSGTDTPPEEQFENLESPVEEIALQPEPPKGQGVYGWITSFFAGKEQETAQEEPAFDFGHIDLQELKNVPLAFKEIEKQIEEEILDVLHDSWDDSTILRKDLLLTEVALKLDKLTLRFVDVKLNTSFEDRRVLAVDLMQVTSRVQLAPRTHTLNVSLNVHDAECAIQRLITTCKRHRDESMHTFELNDSLMYSTSENTKVLLAIGRGTQSSDLSKPLFKMQYRRRSPRLIVRHIVEGTFRPISFVCDENALNGIGSVFEDDPEIAFAQDAITPLEELAETSCEPLQSNRNASSIQLESHVFVDLNLPNISVVLRKKEWETERIKMDCPVEQFAKINIDDAHLSVISKEQFVNTVTLDVGHMDIQDMFEKTKTMQNTTYPLLSTKKTRDLKAASTSCPNLHTITQSVETFSTSLPNEGFLNALSMAQLNAKHERFNVAVSRKASGALKSPSTKCQSRTEASIRCTIIDPRHPEFETKFNKKNCSIDVNMNEVEVGMNRRSWTAMMDFVGLLGVNEEELTSPRRSFAHTDLQKTVSTDLMDIAVTKESFLVACALHIKTLRINMNYPGNGTRLGVISFQEFDLLNTIHLRDIREQLQISLSFLGMKITDRTPGYCNLYDERLILLSENALKPLPSVELNIVKFLGDVDLSRDHDLMIQLTVPKQMHLYYIHTHRYFCALMDFWMQFFELQDHVMKQKKNYVTDGPKTRVKLKVDIQSPASIVLPQNQLSDEVILLKATDIRISNTFKQSSSVLPIFRDSGVIVESDYDTRFANVDCLMDCIRANFSNLEVYEGKRIERIFFKEETDSLPLGRDVFEHFEFMIAKRPIFDERFDLVADIYRNLEGNLSKNFPDLTIITGIQGVTWQLSTDFYCLLRGFLQFNLADPLIPLPETIPIELLEKPDFSCEVGSESKYVTLSLRIFFDNMKVDLLVPSVCASNNNGKVKQPQNNMISTGVFFNRKYEPFARSHLPSAKISFDVYIDGMAEFNLISYNTQLEDKRKAPPGKNTPVVHNIIVTPLVSKSGLPIDVMTEAAILFNKDQPPSVSLVLQGARVVVAPDFLFDAKDFILLSPEFVPPQIDPLTAEEPKKITTLQPNNGVVDRLSTSVELKQQTFDLKITLKATDLYLLENSWSVNSFALILSTEAVLKLNDHDGILQAALEISSTHVDWCLMDALDLTRSQCTNDFKLSIKLAPEEREKMINGLPLLVSQRHVLEVEINNAIGKLSLRDTRVFQVVLESWLEHWKITQGTSSVPIQSFKVPGKPLEIAKTLLSTNNNNFELWVLDDFRKDGCVPMLRCIFSDFMLEYSVERLVTSFTINLDYFNQRVYGWEPFIERWRILRLHLNQKEAIRSLDLKTETKSTLDINLTQDFIQQVVHWKSRFVDIGLEFDRDEFRTQCSTRTRSDHLPYMLKNSTGSELSFTMQVDTFLSAPNTQQRPTTIKWLCVRENGEQDFEFPTKLLDYKARRNDSRQLIIRVDGWEECSPVNVDACGTYFRVVKAAESGRMNARLIVKVTMEKDGKKVVVVQSSIELHNSLPHQITIFNERKKAILTLDPTMTAPIPLKHAHTHFLVQPNCGWKFTELATVTWRNVRIPGEVVNQTVGLNSVEKEQYWLCYSIRREHYPEHEWLPGHTIWIVPSLSILNLLPVDMEIRLQDLMYAIGTGKQLDVSAIDINRDLAFFFTTDRMVTARDYVLNKQTIGDGQRVHIRLIDLQKRPLSVYAELKIIRGGAISIVFWVPYWIINKSGLPLVVKQAAAPCEAAGQMEEHERAKDKHPLMFSFSAEDCPTRCLVRMGLNYTTEKGYTPEFSPQVELSPGVQDVKLKLTHPNLPSLFYNIGIEVRAGTGRYKDTQVVLLTSRYILNNQSSLTLLVCHYDLTERSSEHIHLAPGCNLVWNENYENIRKLCVRRADVKHWSCPFRIDRVGSFHITMRDADETPRFVRVEVILSSAIFYVSFTDASYFPPPIQIENLSDVPVLYQQYSDSTTKQHLRTICKANSTVNYAWDDHAARDKLLLLQVYENRSHIYDPTMQGAGEPLMYENNLYIQFSKSFKNQDKAKKTEECELVLETMQKGKVMLNKQNRLNGNHGNQHWKLCEDGCIENVGMNNRTIKKQRMVLDVLETAGNQLMLCERSDRRDKYQRWNILADGRICCGVAGIYITAGENEVYLSRRENRPVEVNEDMIDVNQVWNIQRQRPGSGKLDVECFHSGPTLVVRITDRAQGGRPMPQSISMPLLSAKPSLAQMTKPQLSTEIAITMRSGIGISIVNSLQEELVYARFGDIVINASKIGDTFQMTGSVGVIQADNQLLNADRWQFIYCQAAMTDDENYTLLENLPAGVPTTARPALKIEMNCTPMKHYDAFDCFRLKLCDFSVQLDELLLWKFIQFVQATDASQRIQPSALEMPPNTELDRPNPLASRKCYFGTLELDMGQIALSVATISKSGLPKDLRLLKQQFNIMLVSFENAGISLPPFRQLHYFETSSFLFELLKKFYFAELQKKVMNVAFYLDAFGNPAGFVTDLKDSFAGLFIEGDVRGFVSGVGYGVSNSISKVASSMAAGVGSLTFDEEHEAKRRHNMIRSHSSSTSTPLGHLYSGVKGLGMGFMGIITSIPTNTVQESKKNGLIAGTFRGVTKGVADMVTKPVQGIFDLVDGTASAVRELAAPLAIKRTSAGSRIRLPRVCVDLYHQLPPYQQLLAWAQMEMLRINGYNQRERLLDVEMVIEQVTMDEVQRQYVLISTEQCYVCKQLNGESWTVLKRFAYKHVKCIQERETVNYLYPVEIMEEEDYSRVKSYHIWCARKEVAERVTEKLVMAKNEYDHNKRTLKEDSL